MLERLAQQDPPLSQPSQPGPIDVHIDLSGLANLIWSTFIDHIGDVGTAIWTPLSAWLTNGIHSAVVSVWNATFGALGDFLSQIPPEWTYDSPAYRAIATDPLSGRLIPAVFLTLAYPVVVVRAVQLLNGAAHAVGTQAAVSTLVGLDPIRIGTNPALLFVWLVLLWYGWRLLLRVAESLVRFVVALVFGPLAITLWAIPQTEWVTWFWLRELVGWGTTPLLVTVALAIAVPLATGRSGELAAAAFGIAGFKAAYDLVGLLSLAHGGSRGVSPLGYIRMAAGAASGGGAGVAAASIPANRMTTLADQYGYQ